MLSDQALRRSFTGEVPHGYIHEGHAAKAVERFLRDHLPDWVSDQQRNLQIPENILTGNLCRFLRSRCRKMETLFDFYPEFPQAPKRRVDLGVHPAQEEGLYVANQMYGLNDAFYALEAKCLPTPGGRRRKREYVIGDGVKQCGGIERFKENLHGNGLLYSGMIAYIQKNKASSWFDNINQWVTDLIMHPPPNALSTWSHNDLLRQETTVTPLVRELSSLHQRGRGDPLHLWHFWLDLTAH
jgi:hypothetical protein